MSRDYNYQAFTPEEVEQGLLQDLLNYLLDHNKKNEHQYYDIHITTDGYVTIIEWNDVSYNQEYGPEGKFEFVPYNGQVMLEYSFPDDHYEMCYSEEDYQERLQEWLKEQERNGIVWEKNQWGCWRNVTENKAAAELYKDLFSTEEEKKDE